MIPKPFSDLMDRLGRAHVAWFAMLLAVTLTTIGILAIDTAEPRYASIQTRWLFIALLAAVLCTLPHPRWIGTLAYPLFGFTIVLLAVIILPVMPRWLVPVRNGATCWINLYFMMAQPSELAKITFVLALAWYLRYGDEYRTLRGLLMPFIFLIVPVGLILLEPDLGTALIFAPALFAMLVAAGCKLRHLAGLVGMAILAIVINVASIYVLPESMQVLKPHQRQRIVAMISQVQGDRRYVNDIGYQQDKAMTLVGSGGVLGYGADRSSTILTFNKLPEDHNDMIFAVIVNRWGLVGGLITLGLYLLLILSLLVVASRIKDAFARLSTVGFIGLLASQAMINIGITLGLLPVTGITLPFISYGGSSLVATFVMVGLILNFASRKPTALNWPSFEFDQPDTAAL